MSRAGAAAVTAMVLAVAAAPPAPAAYDPVVALAFDTYSAGAAPAVTSSLTQKPGEDTTKSGSTILSYDFTLNPDFDATRCGGEALASGRCPEASKIGMASVETPYGPGSGTIHVTEDFRLFALMTAYGGLVRIPLYGTITSRPDGFEVGLDDLPQTPITGGRLQLDGGKRGLFLNPRRCGRYEVGVRFASHGGAAVERKIPIEIVGCATPPAIDGVALAPRRIRRGGGAKLTWRLSRPAARTEVGLYRARGRTWRALGTVAGPAAAGANTLAIGARWKGQALRPGRYRVALRAFAADGTVSRERTTVLRVAVR